MAFSIAWRNVYVIQQAKGGLYPSIVGAVQAQYIDTGWNPGPTLTCGVVNETKEFWFELSSLGQLNPTFIPPVAGVGLLQKLAKLDSNSQDSKITQSLRN